MEQRMPKCLHVIACTPPILACPHPFIVATDASGTAIGAVLRQDVEGVIAFWRQQLKKTERNYRIKYHE